MHSVMGLEELVMFSSMRAYIRLEGELAKPTGHPCKLFAPRISYKLSGGGL